MEHEVNMTAIVAICVVIALYSLVSARLQRWQITPPMAFVGMGFVLATVPISLLHLRISSAGIATIAELTLAVVLFADAAGVKVMELRQDLFVPGRLLLVGLPITMALGTVAAHLLFPGLSWWVCGVIGTAVAPTDAALGAAIIEDERVPARVRRILNVESGLNDGIATPFVNFFVAAAVAGSALATGSKGDALVAIVGGVLGGALIGVAGGWMIEKARAAQWAGSHHRGIGVAALAVVSYAGVVEAGYNGFVAAFVAGLAFGAVTRAEDDDLLKFTHQTASLMSMVVWFLFGAVMVPLLANASWRDWAFAVLALTIIRMAPVALSLVGAGLDRATVGVIGWFGPRGLASVVFALLAAEALAPQASERVVPIITATVVLSVMLHGVSAGPLGARYGASHPAEPPLSV